MKRFFIVTMLLNLIFTNISAEEKSDLSENLFLKYSSADFYISPKTAGVKFTIPFLETRFYKLEDYSLYGINISAQPLYKNLPINLKIGNLTTSGLYSKLKNPLFNSSISPFSVSAPSLPPLTANLPSATTVQKPQSIFFQLGYTNKKNILRDFRINLFSEVQDAPEENTSSTSVVSAKLELALGKKSSSRVAFASCGGFFDYSSKTSNSWFLDEQLYHEGTHFCLINQFAFFNPTITSTFYYGLYETPFSTYSTAFREETSIKTKHFVLSNGAFYIPSSILTSDDNSYTQQLQIKTGIVYRGLVTFNKPLYFSTGINSFVKFNIPTAEQSYKIATGFQFTLPQTAVSFSTTINLNSNLSTQTNIPSSNFSFSSASFQLKNTWYINKISPVFIISWNFNPSTDFSSLSTTQNYEINANFNTNPKITLKNKISITQKNWEKTKQSFTSSLVVIGKLNKLTITCKLGLTLE